MVVIACSGADNREYITKDVPGSIARASGEAGAIALQALVVQLRCNRVDNKGER
jgi:hypothetical protein